MKRPPALTAECFHPTVLNKLIVDFETETVLIEGLSDLGTSIIDLKQLDLHEAPEEFLLKLFDPAHARLICGFRNRYMRLFS
ncbi:hypothetical protein HBO13_30625 [Pseudomonas lactis]|uniref:Uncharacterized protein n=1 Tax=Pseudomonas lactis TaxID=1615674 RepID=A0A7Y1M8I3_9PSED|nr:MULTISPECIES: hypothetical protein [Pseudomonas]NNA76992.1 hypothetical protein [Pseudomonas lactis]